MMYVFLFIIGTVFLSSFGFLLAAEFTSSLEKHRRYLLIGTTILSIFLFLGFSSLDNLVLSFVSLIAVIFLWMKIYSVSQAINDRKEYLRLKAEFERLVSFYSATDEELNAVQHIVYGSLFLSDLDDSVRFDVVKELVYVAESMRPIAPFP